MSELRVGYNADVTLIFGGRFNFPEIAFVLTREYLQAAAQHEGEIKRLGAQILEQAKHYTDQSREYTARIATLEAELQLARADARSFEEQLGIMRERLNVEKQTRRSAPPLEAVIRIDLPSQEVKAAIERATREAIGRHTTAGWQPIETAPKDGTYILLIGTQAGLPDKRWIAPVTGHWSTNRTWHCDSFNLNNPTHWMPLPEPPR